MARVHTTAFNETDCIGDCYEPINNSLNNLDTAIQNLSGVQNTANTNITNLRTDVNSVSSQVYATGSVLQVVYLESSAKQNITSPDISQITGLQATITPKRAGSKILLQAMINNNGLHVASFGFLQYVNPSFVRIGGVSNTNSANAIATTYYGGATTSNDFMYNNYITYLHTPSYTLGQSLVYAPGACASWAGVTYTLQINNRQSNDMNSVSSIILTEIAS